MGRLSGKVAVVVGGASGFGLATAERFAAEGAAVVVAGRREERVRQVADRLGGDAVRCDITDDEQVAALVAAVLERHGRLDVAVNYAGFERSTLIRDLTPELLAPMVQVHFLGAVSVLRHTANAMAEAGGGSIILVSSLTAQNPAAGLAAYAGSKKGVEFVTRIAALEYGPAGVRVNCIAPHLIETPMTEPIFRVPLVVEAVRQQTPLGRMGTVDDVARAVLFLAGDDSAYITGQVLCVDGGASTQKLPSATDYQLLARARPDLVVSPTPPGTSADPTG